MGYADRRERLRRLRLEVVVNRRDSGKPRYDVTIELPIPAGDYLLDPTPWAHPPSPRVERATPETVAGDRPGRSEPFSPASLPAALAPGN